MKQHGIGMKEALFEASKKKEKDLKEKWVGIMALQIGGQKNVLLSIAISYLGTPVYL